MIVENYHKKIPLLISVLFLTLFTRSQVRTDGYYYSITKTTGGGTIFGISQFRSNGLWMDSLVYDTLPALRNGLSKGRNTMKYSVVREGNETVITYEHVNMGPYDVSDCPCQQRVRIEDDGFLSVAIKNRNKAWKKAEGKYYFVPFGD